MSLEAAVDRLHARVVRSLVLQRFADFVRVVLAVGFFAPGLHKLLGLRFTTLPLSNPIGAFFNALYVTGFYYRFLGAAQVLAAVLVLFRRTSTLGALLFFTITLNVFVVTISIPFGTGTPIVTGLMLLASLYLVCWDYDKLKPLLPFLNSASAQQEAASPQISHPTSLIGQLGFWLAAIFGILVTCGMRGLTFDDRWFKRTGLLGGLVGGMLMLAGFVIDVGKMIKASRIQIR